jgi:hypothetical protein
VKNGKLLLTAEDIQLLKTRGAGVKNVSLDEMFRMGKFEMIDGAETEDTFIATYFSQVTEKDMTHCEVCPLGMLGIAAGLSP